MLSDRPSSGGGQDGLPPDGGLLCRRPGGRRGRRPLGALEGRPSGAQEEKLPQKGQHAGELVVTGAQGGSVREAGVIAFVVVVVINWTYFL